MKDQLNRKLQLNLTPKRIVSLVPSQTELLVDLGLEDSIVGTTKFCVHPRHLSKEKAIVGGTKQINPKKINELQPDIILCNKEENTKEIIEELETIAPIHISDIYNLEDCYVLIKLYGEVFKVEAKALDLISNIQKTREHYKRNIKNRTKPKVAYFIWKNPWMVSASETFIDYMLEEAGFQNVFENEKRYPEIDLNDEKLQQADTIFLSNEPFPFKENHIEALRVYFPKKEIKIVDGELFSWYGSRLLKSYDYFKTLHV